MEFFFVWLRCRGRSKIGESESRRRTVSSMDFYMDGNGKGEGVKVE